MTPSLWALACVVTFMLGWYSRHLSIVKDQSDTEDSFNAEWDRLEASTKLVVEATDAKAKIMQQAADVLLNAARTEKSAAEALESSAARVKALEQEVGQSRQVLESIDSQQGAILSALINMGTMQGIDMGRRDQRQVGEPEPPPFRDDDGPLAVIR